MPIKEPDYPKPMYAPSGTVVYAHDAKSEDELAKEGFSATYSFQEFPKSLYHPQKKLIAQVDSKEEEATLVDAGWLAKPLEIHYGEDVRRATAYEKTAATRAPKEPKEKEPKEKSR